MKNYIPYVILLILFTADSIMKMSLDRSVKKVKVISFLFLAQRFILPCGIFFGILLSVLINEDIVSYFLIGSFILKIISKVIDKISNKN